jgi:hypothetical protein
VEFRKWWDIAQVVVLMYVAITVPLRIGFRLENLEPSDFGFWVDLVVDFYFWFDIFLNFRTAYRDDRDTMHRLIVNLKSIRNRYFKGWFLIDFVSCLPLNYIELIYQVVTENESQGGGASDVKVLKVRDPPSARA